MGTVTIHLYDNNESCKKYAFSSLEVNAAVELCRNHSLEDEVENIVADITVPKGFYESMNIKRSPKGSQKDESELSAN